MATELVIKSWCDPCLSGDINTPGETLNVPALFGEPAFDIEVCTEHGKRIREAIEALRTYGRAAGTGRPKVPTTTTNARRTPGGRVQRGDDVTGPVACPVCGHSAPSLSAVRGHLRDHHQKSLADVGLAENKMQCPECGSGFPNGQGLAAHIRVTHPGAAQKAS